MKICIVQLQLELTHGDAVMVKLALSDAVCQVLGVEYFYNSI